MISAHGQSQGLAINLQYTLYHVINIFENEVSSVTAMHPPRNLVRPIQPRAALCGFCYKLQVYFASLLEVNLKFTSEWLKKTTFVTFCKIEKNEFKVYICFYCTSGSGVPRTVQILNLSAIG